MDKKTFKTIEDFKQYLKTDFDPNESVIINGIEFPTIIDAIDFFDGEV